MDATEINHLILKQNNPFQKKNIKKSYPDYYIFVEKSYLNYTLVHCMLHFFSNVCKENQY